MLTRGEDPIQLRARALGLVLALLACACAEPPALLAGRLTYLELRRIEGQEQPRPPRAVLRVGIPEGSRRWGVHVERPAILPGEGDTEVRVWKGGGQVHVPGPVDLSGVNRVEVVGRVRAGHQFELKLVDGEEELVTEGLRAETSGAPRADGLERLALDLQGLPEAHARAWQALDFTVRGRDCEVHALEFLEVAPEDLLPDAADPRQVALAGEYRRCAGLAAERGLEASFDAAPGDELVFGLGVPAHVQAPLERAEVVVTLQAGGAQELVRFPLQDLAEVGRGWTTQRLSLESFAGLRVRARWELHNAGAARVAAVLGLPRVGQRDARAPTVLLITSDAHRADHLAAASDGIEIRTPILDALAARGVLFEDCYSESHITCPSHASILTGLSPRDTGLVSNASAWPARPSPWRGCSGSRATRPSACSARSTSDPRAATWPRTSTAWRFPRARRGRPSSRSPGCWSGSTTPRVTPSSPGSTSSTRTSPMPRRGSSTGCTTRPPRTPTTRHCPRSS